MAAHTPWPKVTVYYVVARNKEERKERPPNFLQGYATLQKVPPPLNRATRAAKPSGYGSPRLEPTECGARQCRQRDQSSTSLRYTRSRLKDPGSSEPLQNKEGAREKAQDLHLYFTRKIHVEIKIQWTLNPVHKL